MSASKKAAAIRRKLSEDALSRTGGTWSKKKVTVEQKLAALKWALSRQYEPFNWVVECWEDSQLIEMIERHGGVQSLAKEISAHAQIVCDQEAEVKAAGGIDACNPWY